MNIVAVKIMVETGIDLCYNYLLNFGFSTLENDNHAATALGGLTNGVTQLEVAAAYGTIANQGQYIKPCFYNKVLDHDGNVLLENTKETKQVLKSSTGYILTEMMTDTIKSGTGTKANLGNMPVAGKTGTTTDSKDLTFVGYTPYYVCSIWLGYDTYDSTVKNMSNVNQSQHIVIWKDIMSKVHQNLEVKDFEMPDTVEKATVCKISGKLARSGCPSVTDYFDKESLGGEYCTSHKGYSGVVFSSGNYYKPSGAGSNSTGSSTNNSSGNESDNEGTTAGSEAGENENNGTGENSNTVDNTGGNSGASTDTSNTDVPQVETPVDTPPADVQEVSPAAE